MDTISPLRDLGLQSVELTERTVMKKDILNKAREAEEKRKKEKILETADKQPVDPAGVQKFFSIASKIDPNWLKKRTSLAMWKKKTLKMILMKTKGGVQLRSQIKTMFKGSEEETLRFSWCLYMEKKIKGKVSQGKVLSKNDKDSLEQVVLN